MFIAIYHNKLFPRFKQIFQNGLHIHYDRINRLLRKAMQLKEKEMNDIISKEKNEFSIHLGDIYKNPIVLLLIGLASSIFAFVLEIIYFIIFKIILIHYYIFYYF